MRKCGESNIVLGENDIIWNPWYGCKACSVGCANCRSLLYCNSVKQSKSEFRLPIQKKREKNKVLEKYELQYKIESGSIIWVCTSSDFFIEEADSFRQEAWDIIHKRQDCLFHIITKRPERIKQSLPEYWLGGWNNVIISVSIEDEDTLWDRVPLLLDLPIKHMGIFAEPLLEEIDLSPQLSSGLIEYVYVGGETDIIGKSRELDMKWVKRIREQCEYYEVNFKFLRTGTRLRLENNQLLNISSRDERGLADFYKLDRITQSWESTAQELELQSLAENAYVVYKKIHTDNT